MNNIFFFTYGISNYTGNRLLYCLDVKVFGGKLVKNSFTRCWVPFRDFTCFHVRLYTFSIIVQQWLKSPRFVLYLHIGETRSFSLPGTWSKVSSTKKKTSLNISGKEVDFARNLFRKQRICHQKSINIQQSFCLGRRATLYREGLINVNRNLDKAVSKKEDFKRQDRRRSFSISFIVFIRQFWNRVCKQDSCST